MKLRRKIVLVGTIAIIVCTFVSCTNTKVDANKPRTFMWEVKNGNKKLFLLGSVHIGTKELYPLDTNITKAFENSDVLGVELNPNNVDFMELISVLFDFSGEGYKKLPQEVKDKLKEKIEKFDDSGMDAKMFETMNPVGIAFMLETLKISELANNIDDIQNSIAIGIDNYFLNLADSLNKEIYELESVERQLQVFTNLGDLINEYILTSLEQDTQLKLEDFNKITTAWKNGDVKTIEEFTNINYSKNEQLNTKIKDELIIKRNKEMAKKIEKLFEENKKYFIVVGAGHLIGKDGIIDLLQKTGKYEIKHY
ncbi:MAG: TraB/GumN family protein [Ignavibacteria bacterium]|nr:TraB/GumN family protein [Ignavibacteria bacterium]